MLVLVLAIYAPASGSVTSTKASPLKLSRSPISPLPFPPWLSISLLRLRLVGTPSPSVTRCGVCSCLLPRRILPSLFSMSTIFVDRGFPRLPLACVLRLRCPPMLPGATTSASSLFCHDWLLMLETVVTWSMLTPDRSLVPIVVRISSGSLASGASSPPNLPVT